jgi:hypothetical protein
MEQAAAAYTLNTTLEWWKEYTTVPPMQHADVSRRKVIAYYANSSCSACDACPRVRIDSRSWPHVVLSHTLPALLAPGKHLTMHIQPSEEDWRLDVFEASHVDFSLDFHVVAWLHASSAPSIRVRVCVLRGSVKGAGWLNGVSDLNEDSCQAGATIHLISARDGGDKNAQVTRTVPLPRSAQGWTVVMSNQGVDSARLCRPENAAFDDGQPCIPELGQNKVNIRAYAQIKTVGSCCGAVGDTPAQVFENTRSLGEFSSHVESLGSADTCARNSVEYCDGTQHSGRQLDLCSVCGGSCFEPTCSKEACVETSSTPLLLRLRYNGEFWQSPRWGVPPGVIERDYMFKIPKKRPEACQINACKALCLSTEDMPSLFPDCYGRRDAYKIDTRVLATGMGTVEFKQGNFSFDIRPDGAGEVAAASNMAAGSRHSQKWLLELTCFRDPELHRRYQRDASRGTKANWAGDSKADKVTLLPASRV